MSAEQKKPYEEKYQVLSAKYKEELQAWKAEQGDAANEGAEAEDDNEESEATKAESPASEKAKAAPKKRASHGEAEQTKCSPPQKKAKGRGRGKGASSAPVPEKETISADVLKKASSIGLEVALKNLAERPGMSDIPAEKMLAALQQAGGLVNKAKVALLAGA